jgi:ATP-binding cassette subfamily D (ALD) long-chain fatty acid import protein
MAAVLALKGRFDALGRLTKQYGAQPGLRPRQNRALLVLATIIFLLGIVSGSYKIKNWHHKGKLDKAHTQRLLRRNSGLRGVDGSRTIYVPYRETSAKVVIYPTKTTTFDAHRRLFLNPPRASGLANEKAANTDAKKAGMGLGFLHQYLSLLNIMIPRWHGKEAGLLLSQGAFLMLRTYLSLLVARLDGAIVRDLVSGNGRGFAWGILKWCGIGGETSQVSSGARFTD